ncbi:zinc-binding dehydrogenase [Streptomyces sp. DG2A-72]|uniref:quinone oxidoreductase family protein n=1 Tax=Streptomyces sp. DG2A-72 TaxID=3051386 RepID=UPI00265B7FAF|nr:zinc-binding dehydrogenase [Streptomyces sp. DG2A-72]MDO0932261.1 zinc-binding dehydrogenase [Streptomyces sp. DG2A-72]
MVVEEVPVPEPAPSEVLIKVMAAGVNWADAHRRQGQYYPEPTDFPFTVGGEFAGEIVSTGRDVTRHRAGDVVFALHNGGAYAQYAIADQDAVFRVPDGLDPIAGVALIVQGLTAAAILKDATPVQPGEAVLVQGASGGVGMIALQLARIYGASKVFGLASSPHKRDFIRTHGGHALDPADATWPDQLRAATDQQGADVVMEMAGGEMFRRSLDVMAQGGRMTVYGAVGEGDRTVDLLQLIPRNLTLRSFYLGPYLARPDFVDSTIAELAEYVKDGRLKLTLGGRYQLDQAPEMHRLMEARQTTGKLVVLPT